MYEHFTRDFGGRGSAAEVWIDKDRKLVKKYYKVGGIGHRSETIVENHYETLKQLYDAEIHWSKQFKHWAVELYEHGEIDNGFYLVQEYCGPDLLVYYNQKTLHKEFPNIVDELHQFFLELQDKKVYKHNHALSNMTGKDGKIKMFDFKYMVPRTPDGRKYEHKCINDWLVKIDPDIPALLKPTI